jgi:23S rRNA (uracil1939-C5)-methyltransferase
MQIGDSAEVVADAIAPDGRGVGDAGGHRVHVADLLPGERARVIIEHVSPHTGDAWAGLDERLGDAVPERVAPACPAFGRCGGCAWQHLAYPAQLIEKRRIVERALPGAAVADVEPSPREARYRNYGKYVIGDRVVGAYAPRSHQLVSTLGCAIVEPVIDRIACAVAERVPGCGLPVYDEATRAGQLRYAVIRSDGERALAGIVTTSAAPADRVRALAADLRGAVPELAGVVHVENDSTGGAILGPTQRTVAGAATLRERIGDLEVEVGIGAFFQINRDQAARMYARVADLTGAGRGTRAVDVYCGVGGIALTLAARGATVTGIERDADAIATARAAAARNRLDVRFEVAPSRQLGTLVDAADLVVVNPPRRGLDAATRGGVIALAPEMIAYVSCNPSTLARDLDALAAAGYRVETVEPFDLMPGTAQVETVAVLKH